MRKELIDNNPLIKLSIEFSLAIIDFCEVLNTEKKYIVSNQLLRCGTAIGASSMEAQSAESKADFIHKIKIAAKEAEETQYWSLLCQHGAGYPRPVGLDEKLEVLNKISAVFCQELRRNHP